MSVGNTAKRNLPSLIDEAHSSTTDSYMSSVSQVLTETDTEDGTIDEIQEVTALRMPLELKMRTGAKTMFQSLLTATPAGNYLHSCWYNTARWL